MTSARYWRAINAVVRQERQKPGHFVLTDAIETKRQIIDFNRSCLKLITIIWQMLSPSLEPAFLNGTRNGVVQNQCNDTTHCHACWKQDSQYLVDFWYSCLRYMSLKFVWSHKNNNKYGLLNEREVKVAGYYLFCGVNGSINTWKRIGHEYPVILTEQAWSIKKLLYGIKTHFFLRNTARDPEQAR